MAKDVSNSCYLNQVARSDLCSESSNQLFTRHATRNIRMAITNRQTEQNVRTSNDQTMIDVLRLAQRMSPPRPRRQSSHHSPPRSTRPARSPGSAHSTRRPDSRRHRLSALPLIPSGGRLSKEDLFFPPSQVTEAQLCDPATRVILNTPEMTLISCVVDGGTMYYFGVPPLSE
jgi:hypothetical protein